MKNILNITNGDCAVEIMKEAKISGEFLPWRDVLHDGPIPEGLTLEELSKIRAEFIVSRGWAEPENIERDFIERDNILNSFQKYEKVILWFEHDLYDQLQTLQILDWFHEIDISEVELSIICTDKYLGKLSPDEMKGLLKYEEPITEEHLRLSSKAWSAFRKDSPKDWNRLLNEDTSLLPFLEGAVIRMLEEYPNCSNGLSRTAQQALKILSEGKNLAGEVFALNQALEERVYLGDSIFWTILQEFIDSRPALLVLSEGKKLTKSNAKMQELSITSVGLDVLSCKRSWLDINSQDRWIGGVHLDENNVYCWNPHSGSILKKALQVGED